MSIEYNKKKFNVLMNGNCNFLLGLLVEMLLSELRSTFLIGDWFMYPVHLTGNGVRKCHLSAPV